MNAAIKKLRGMNPNANWKNVNGANLTNGQKKVLNGLRLGAAYVGLRRQQTAQANLNTGTVFTQAQTSSQAAANIVAKAIQSAKNAAAKAEENAARAQAEANAAKAKANANAAAARNAEARAAAKKMTNNAIQKAKNAAAAEKAANNARKAAEEAAAAKTAQEARNAAAKAAKNAAIAAAAASRGGGIVKPASRGGGIVNPAATQAPKRNLKEIYDFPEDGNFGEVIRAVSNDVWKHFESRKDPAEIAWLVLKSRGQTVNRTPYRAGFIMDQYNWKRLYDRFKGRGILPKYKQVLRYILAMLALNPPYKNRKTGNRNKLSGQPRIGTMNNVSFNAYLNALKPVANQGAGLAKAFLRTTASGAGLAARTAVNKKDIILPIAAVALSAGLAGGPMAAGTAARAAAKAAVKKAIVNAAKSKLGGNPLSNVLVNRAAAMAENSIASMTAPTENSIKEVLASAANQALAAPAAPSVNTAFINSTAAQYRKKIYSNIGPYAGNEYGTRNARANKGAAAIKQYLKNAAAAGKNIKTNSTVKQDLQGLYRMAVYPRSNRPPQFSNMAWAAAGALVATAVAAPLASYVVGGATTAATKKAVNVGVNKATQFARQQAAKKAANLARQQAAKKAVQTTRGMAATRASQAARQGVAAAAKRASPWSIPNNFTRKLLNRAAKGNHTITTNMINTAVQRAGGDPRVAAALEKGGQVALNLLRSRV